MADSTIVSPPSVVVTLDNKVGSDIAASIAAAEESKTEGNGYFRIGRWDEALVAYRSGLGHLPSRINQSQNLPSNETEGHEDRATHDNEDDSNRTSNSPNKSQSESEEYVKLRAVLNGNIGACYVKLGDHKKAVDACSEALIDDPRYVKALQRRASSNVLINSWSSLTAAQEDYTALLELFPTESSQLRDIERSLKSLKPRVEAAQKQETAEMLDKLKGFGNSILGNFGLSTDNFKLEPNGQGGYSMNFSR